MGIFGQSSTPFDAEIEKATSETNTNENWSLILEVCDKVSMNPRVAKDCLKAIMKRMGNNDPHVVLHAITLLDACSSNCGKPFHLEIASREFENEFKRLLVKAQPEVSLKMRQVLKNWAENDFKNDPELNLIPSLYKNLLCEGYEFNNLNDKPAKSSAKISAALKDPNVVSSQQEEDDIAKAIELSLKEAKNSPKHQANPNSGASGVTNSATSYPSLYPSFAGSGSLGSITSTGGASNNSTGSQAEPRKVRALYDFEAAEENELTFFSGEIIHVLDDSDPNWWKGYNQRGDGLFPSNFVTADLSVDPERLDINQQNKSKKNVQFEDDVKELQQKTEAAATVAANQRVEIDETKVDRLLHLLHEANPEDPSQDSEEMLRLEQEVHQMGPLIDAELERVDRKHAQLTQLSSDLVDAINLYHSLMRDDRASALGMAAGVGGNFMGGMMPGMPGAMSSLGYPAGSNSQMGLYGPAGYNTATATGSNFPLHQNYGLPSLPYASSSSMPSMPGPGPGALHTQGMQMGNVNAMQIPLQYHNGHVNTPLLNGGSGGGGAGINALPQQQMNSTLAPGQPQQQSQIPPQQQMFGNLSGQQPQQLQQQPIQAPPQQQQQPNYQMFLPQHQQQQQQAQQPQQYPQQPQVTTALPPTTTIDNNSQQSTAPPLQQHQHQQQQQQQQQFISPQHQPPVHHASYMQLHHQQQQQQQPPIQPPPTQHHQQQHQFGPLTNGPQQNFITPSTIGSAILPGMMQQLPPTIHNGGNGNPIGNNNGDQYSQLQQQMAAMSMGHNQPVTQNFLVQNEPKNNIPIYQQQR